MRYFIAGIGYVIFGLLGIGIHFILRYTIKFFQLLVELTDSLEVTWLNIVLPDQDLDDEEDW